MKRSIFGPIIFGIIFGAAAFFAPFFFLKAIFFFMIIGFIMRMFWWRRHAWHYGYQYQTIFADKIRSMSEEEYAEFKNKFNACNHHYNSWCDNRYYNHDCRGNWSKDCWNDTQKKEEQPTK